MINKADISITVEDIENNGFFKVSDGNGGSLVVNTFFNPETLEEQRITVRDYDYEPSVKDNDDLYNLPVNDAVRRVWLHHNGHILEGDVIRVYKGRKVKKGTIATVKGFRDIYDKYNRWIAKYAILDNGISLNIDNCELYKGV